MTGIPAENGEVFDDSPMVGPPVDSPPVMDVNGDDIASPSAGFPSPTDVASPPAAKSDTTTTPTPTPSTSPHPPPAGLSEEEKQPQKRGVRQDILRVLLDKFGGWRGTIILLSAGSVALIFLLLTSNTEETVSTVETSVDPTEQETQDVQGEDEIIIPPDDEPSTDPASMAEQSETGTGVPYDSLSPAAELPERSGITAGHQGAEEIAETAAEILLQKDRGGLDVWEAEKKMMALYLDTDIWAGTLEAYLDPDPMLNAIRKVLVGVLDDDDPYSREGMEEALNEVENIRDGVASAQPLSLDVWGNLSDNCSWSAQWEGNAYEYRVTVRGQNDEHVETGRYEWVKGPSDWTQSVGAQGNPDWTGAPPDGIHVTVEGRREGEEAGIQQTLVLDTSDACGS